MFWQIMQASSFWIFLLAVLWYTYSLRPNRHLLIADLGLTLPILFGALSTVAEKLSPTQSWAQTVATFMQSPAGRLLIVIMLGSCICTAVYYLVGEALAKDTNN